MYKKYLKYKLKYLNIKQNNNDKILNGGTITSKNNISVKLQLDKYTT